MGEQMEPEPWMRGTLTEVEPVRRAVLHSLQMAAEDATRWCEGLSEAEMFARPFGLPSVAFQLRHAVRSLDRLLTYAEGRPLTEEQLAALKTEMDAGPKDEVLLEFREGLEGAMLRILAIEPNCFGEVRGVGPEDVADYGGGVIDPCR